jgi:hypothetical protein
MLVQFKRFHIIISGGSNNKRHIFSSVQHRLSQILSLVEGSDSKARIVEYFKLGDIKINRPIIDYTSKKMTDLRNLLSSL